ncbi:MAG: hypothetical protein HKO59_12940 [Phycisphaerales bacterium]|nr:hypothetical protein [Phycisphaerales bacterium]NNM26868.1 hypothetical protein [Phycisphaerales bacterium]
MIDEGPSSEDLERFGGDTVTCRSCGAEIWHDAPVCPECGAVDGVGPERASFDQRQRAIIAVVLAVLLAGLIGFFGLRLF